MSVRRGSYVALGISLVVCGLGLSAAPLQTRPDSPTTRGSDPRSPAESLRALHLAPGFEAEVVASEPLI